MEIVRHSQTNHVFTAPPGEEGQVAELPVITAETEIGIGHFSFWKPNPEELTQLNAGHAIQLGVYTEGHPVVSVGISLEPMYSSGPVPLGDPV